MKDTIYTIPLTDAFNSEDECPFCYITRNLEQDAISFILGSAYMEDDIREQTDKMGFCKEHYKKMYDYGNRLGTALMLHTHYKALEKELKAKMESFSPSQTSFFSKFKKTKASTDSSLDALPHWIKAQDKSCYICNRIDTNFKRYMDTFFYLYTHNPEFKQLFSNSKGFCITHFGDLMTLSETKLNTSQKESFYPLLFAKMEENLKRIEEDLSWFIDKYDYQNQDAPWKSSKDAIPRGIQKLVGTYVQDPPFKEN
ncbi:hypothetical protein CS063_13330 [Sporanaerobium hydrogeniformans]|uniref:Uncharacterized protein n=1 Tax=Sporanaerobium hydrogeniformans TaxID=3072179 RepID=A0AC61DB31_9FIRM|nr:DUF6062 family protein [Sporanaerobium hydrogeniformans]PHV69958.1 hypothetical protein CS063_13330 [Sporanaerobium hydrogeniformans]